MPATRKNRNLKLAAFGCSIPLVAMLAIFLVYIAGPYQFVGIFLGHWRLLDDTPAAYQESRARGAALVEALTQYHADHLDYPASLEDLAPKYLPAIQNPTVGRGRWEYTRHTPARYTLHLFVGPIYEHDTYDTKTGSWYVDR